MPGASHNVQLCGTSVVADKPPVPSVIHPLSTPGYVFIFQFIFGCIFNVLVFTATYSFLVVAIPVALVVKVCHKCVLWAPVRSQGGRNAVVASADEKYWFLVTTQTQSPSLILLLVVKGRLGMETMNFLVRNRLIHNNNNNDKDDDEEKPQLSRLAKTPRHIFHELLWFERDIGDKPVREVNPERMRGLRTEKRMFPVGHSFSDKEWDIYLYSNGDTLTDDIILFRFHHCFADLHTLVYFLSRNFLDEPTFAFQNDISAKRALCTGFLAFLSGPSIFVRSLLKSNDNLFLRPRVLKQERAIFYSEPINKLLVDTITTATGASASDVLLSCLAGSLRTCLKQKGVTFPSDVTAYVPLNLQSSAALKCFTSFNILSLPVGTEGAIPRLWEMRLRRNSISSTVQAITMTTIMQLTFLILPEGLARRLIQFLMGKCSCTVTSILGQALEGDMLIDGRTVEAFLPIEDNDVGLSTTIIEYERQFRLAVLAPTAEDWVIRPDQLCDNFVLKVCELSTRLTERARVVRARGQKILNSRKNSVFNAEEEEQ